ncbi:MAG: hypothetical protein IPL73_30935 [Candidatus Obscuribacter sp.]|nr:hypothetical protein [Candidatus Obscuribacter sp.]
MLSAEFNRATGEIIIRKDADNTITTKLNGEVTTLNRAAGNLKTEFDAKGEVKAISSDYIGSLKRQQDPSDSTKTTFVDDKGISGYKVQKGLLNSVDITKPNGDRAFVMPNGLRGEMTADGAQSRWFDKDNQLTQVRDGIDSYSIDRADPAKPQVTHQSDGAAVTKMPILDANASAADKANYPYATLDKATGALTIHDNANNSYTKNPDFSTINRVSDGNTSRTILSDKTGNLVSIETSKTVDGHTLSVTTDASGRVQSATLPDGSKVEYVPGDSAHDHSYLKTSPDGKYETIGGVTNDFAAGLKYSDSKGNLQTINADGTRVENDVTQGRIKNFSASGDMTSMVDTKDGFTYTFKYDANHNLTEVTNRAGVWQVVPGTTDPVTGEAKWLRTATVAAKASADGTFAVTPIKNPSYVWEGKNSTTDGDYNFVKKTSDAVRPIMDGQNNQTGTLYVGQNGTQYRIMGTGDNIKSMEISKDNGKTFVAVDLANKSVKLDSTTKLPVITEKTSDGKLVGTQTYDAKGGIISRDENNNIVRTVDAKGNGYEYFRDDKTGEIMGANSLKNGVTNIAIGGIGDKYGIDATTKMPVVIHPDKSTTSFDGKGGEIVRNADGLTTSVKQSDGTLTNYTYDGNTVKSSLTKYPDTDVTKEQFFTPSGTVTVVRDSTGVASVKSDVPGAVAFDVQPGQIIKTNALGQVVIESANGNQRTVFGTGTSQYLDKATGAVSLYNTKGELISTTLPPAPGTGGTRPGAVPGTVTVGDGSPAPSLPPRGQPSESPKQPAEAPKPGEPGKTPLEPGKAPVEAPKLPPEPAKNLPPVNDPNQGALDKGKVQQVNTNDAAALDQLLSGVVKQQAANAAACSSSCCRQSEALKLPEAAPAPRAPEAPPPPRSSIQLPLPRRNFSACTSID